MVPRTGWPWTVWSWLLESPPVVLFLLNLIVLPRTRGVEILLVWFFLSPGITQNGIYLNFGVVQDGFGCPFAFSLTV